MRKKKDKCSHGYWKKNMIRDVKKFDDKLSEYVVPVFGIFVISEDITIHKEINNMKFKNIMKVVNFSNKFKYQIDALGKNLSEKIQKMEWCISLEDKKRVELEISYRSIESTIGNKLSLGTDFYFKNLERILYYVRQAYNITSLNDICNELDLLRIV